MAENIAVGAVKVGDFGSIQLKELAEKELFARIKPKVGSWRNRCYEKNLDPNYKTVSFRSVVFPKALDEQNYILLEGIKPDPTGKLTFIEQTIEVEPRGFYAEYTDRDVHFGFDNIVDNLILSTENQANDVLDQIAAKAWQGGNNVYTSASGLTREDFIKIRISLKKFTQSKGAKVKAILSPEDIAELRLAYNKGGTNLFQDLPLNEQSVMNGTIARFEGVDIEEDDSPFMYQMDATTGTVSTNKRYAYFYIKDSQGREPVGFTKANGETGEFIHKALGSGGATNDPLNQVGTIGVKFRGIAAAITAEECLIRVEITARTTDGMNTVNSYIDDFGNITVDGNTVARSGDIETKASPAVITIVAPSLTIKGTGKLQLKAFDNEGNEITKTASWTSGTVATATVGAATGLVTGVAAGTTVITCKKAGLADAKVTVTVIQ